MARINVCSDNEVKWQRGWSGANPSVVSPRGRGCSGGNHDSTALSDSRGNQGGDGRSSWGCGGSGCSGGGGSCAGATDRRRGGTPHPGRKVIPSRVFTILKPEKEKKGGGGAAETGNGMGNENERKKKGFI